MAAGPGWRRGRPTTRQRRGGEGGIDANLYPDDASAAAKDRCAINIMQDQLDTQDQLDGEWSCIP